MASVLSQIQKESLICGILVAIKKIFRQKTTHGETFVGATGLLSQKTHRTASALLDEPEESEPRSFANYVRMYVERFNLLLDKRFVDGYENRTHLC